VRHTDTHLLAQSSSSASGAFIALPCLSTYRERESPERSVSVGRKAMSHLQWQRTDTACSQHVKLFPALDCCPVNTYCMLCCAVLCCLLQSPIAVAGYPFGGDSLSITKGIVSRVAMVGVGGRARNLSAGFGGSLFAGRDLELLAGQDVSDG
jgi:hypothetical protein